MEEDMQGQEGEGGEEMEEEEEEEARSGPSRRRRGAIKGQSDGKWAKNQQKKARGAFSTTAVKETWLEGTDLNSMHTYSTSASAWRPRRSGR